MKALQIELDVVRFASTKTLSLLSKKNTFTSLTPVSLNDVDPPTKPNPDWYRLKPILAGICGSDIASIKGETSKYFSRIVSLPFTLGHEIVGKISDGDLAGKRVVVESVLSCKPRSIEPMCKQCAQGNIHLCENITFGHLHPGLQIGFCKDTGGGWSEELIVHKSQIYEVPDAMTDEEAVMVEPSACGIHTALRANIGPDDNVVILGAGTIGLTTLAAIRNFSNPKTLTITAKYPVQQKFANLFEADIVIKPEELLRSVRRLTNSWAVPPPLSIPSVLLEKLLGKQDNTRQDADLGNSAQRQRRERNISPTAVIDRLTSGADTIIDCIGNSKSIAQALSIVRPGGKIILAGMPGEVKIDLAPLWQREISIIGSYGYGVEQISHKGRKVAPPTSFSLAIDLVQKAKLGRLVSAKYPLDRYQDAITHAIRAGSRDSVKVVFALNETAG